MNNETKQPGITEPQQNEKLVEVEGKLLSEKNTLRSTKIFSFVAMALSVGTLVLIIISFTKPWSAWISILLSILFILFFIVLILFGVAFFSAKSEIESLESKKRIISGFSMNTENKKEYFERLLEVNVENLDSYYRMVKTHNVQSFKVSLTLSGIGVLFIAIGLVLGFQMTGDKTIIAYITSGSGILLEIVSGLLFYLYNKTVRQLKDYHDSLINSQNTFLAFRLIDTVDGNTEKSSLIMKMIDALSKRSETNQVQ